MLTDGATRRRVGCGSILYEGFQIEKLAFPKNVSIMFLAWPLWPKFLTVSVLNSREPDLVPGRLKSEILLATDKKTALFNTRPNGKTNKQTVRNIVPVDGL